MSLRFFILIFLFSICLNASIAQTDSIISDSVTVNSFQTRLEFNGYVKLLETSLIFKNNSDWINDKLIHNRLNFKLSLTKHLNVIAEFRNRIYNGEMMGFYTGYDKLVTNDQGFVNLSWMLLKENNSFVNVFLDRAYIDFSKGKLQLTAGRQRINWGQTFAWNPNDIFNTYSFFDFDYEEKPGCDAVRLQYYRTATSTIEMAAKINSDRQLTAAFLYKTNYRKYDLQGMAGLYNDSDAVAGLGWSGDLFKGGFRGEISWFHPVKNMTDTSGRLLISAGYDYSFKNQAGVRLEILYNSAGKSAGNITMQELYYEPLSAKNLSPAVFSVFGSLTYPVNPIAYVSFSGNYSPAINSLYLGPSLDVSLNDNLDLSFVLQSFLNKLDKADIESVFLFFYRIKWSF
jgi:hypothetical protein